MHTKKKILYVITKGNLGGAQRYVYDLATSLPSETFEAVVAYGDKDGYALANLLSEKNIRVIKIEGLGKELDILKDFKVFRNLINIIKAEKPNVVHLNSSKIGLLGSLAVFYIKLTSKYSPKSIFTAHNWAFNYQNNSVISNFSYYISHYFTTIFCDVTICVSKKIRGDISLFPFIKNKIKVIYNGISNFETLPREEARLILAGTETNKVIILSTSELHKNKGLDTALRAIALLPQATREKIIYSIAGTGEEKENLEKLVSELKITGLVKFLGFIPNAKSLLSGNDIFLLPSRTEAFPYSILEAGLVGQPIVATCVGGVPEVIKDMQSGILVHPRKPKEIAEAILYLSDHPDQQREFGNKIKHTVSNSFSLAKMLEETVKLYR